MSWQREYKQPGIGSVAFFVGGVLIFIGLIFLALFGVAGVLILALGAAVPAAIWFLGTTTTVWCNERGFVVRTESKRKGVSQVEYGWHEVTATQYHEQVGARNSDGDNRPTQHFAVDTVRGRAFDVTRRTRNFPDLIEVFNVMAVQVPYVWKPRTGFTVQFGPMTAGRGAYQAIPRDQYQQQ